MSAPTHPCVDCGELTRGVARCWSCYGKTREAFDSARLWDHVSKTEGDGCWIWTRTRTSKGYGQLAFLGRVVRAHRVAWEITFGSVPKGLFVLHRCDNPPCVRPSHLFLGTAADNSKDMVAKGRYRSGTARLTPDEVRSIRASHENAADLARTVGVSAHAIRAIRRGARWMTVV